MEGVLPSLKDNAVIIMDNAPYHSVKTEKCPTTNWTKADIVQWLESKGEIIDQSIIIVELLDVVKRLKPQYSKYVIDEMVRIHNKTILRLPPYHCELNSIELARLVVKNHVKANNKIFKLLDVQKLLVEGVEKVDATMWKNFISYTIGEEDRFWILDTIAEELIKTQIVVMTIGDASSNEYDEDDE